MATTSRNVIHFRHTPFLGPKPTSLLAPSLRVPHSIQKFNGVLRFKRRKPGLTVCFVLEDEKLAHLGSRDLGEGSGDDGCGREIPEAAVAAGVAEKVARKKSERFTYLMAAVMSTFGITSMAVMAVYYRFAWQMEVKFYSFFFFQIILALFLDDFLFIYSFPAYYLFLFSLFSECE